MASRHITGSVKATVILCLVFIAIVLGMLVYKVTRVPVLTEEQLRELGVVVLPKPRQLTPFELTDQNGEPFTNSGFEGRWNFVFFGFTNCPDICPTTMSVLGKAKRQIEEAHPDLIGGFHGMLVSVDPDRDTVEQLRNYVGAFSSDFTGLTGGRAAIAELTTQVNVAFGKIPDGLGGYTVDHTGNIVIINPYGHYHGFIKMPHEPETVRDAYLSLQDGF